MHFLMGITTLNAENDKGGNFTYRHVIMSFTLPLDCHLVIAMKFKNLSESSKMYKSCCIWKGTFKYDIGFDLATIFQSHFKVKAFFIQEQLFFNAEILFNFPTS